MPRRIQRKRTKGWRMPPNTVYVGRPTVWGNPFRNEGDWVYVFAGHRRTILDPWVIYCEIGEIDAWGLFYDLLHDPDTHPVDVAIMDHFNQMRDVIYDLRHKNLACWCPLDQPCHADVLLELANA